MDNNQWEQAKAEWKKAQEVWMATPAGQQLLNAKSKWEKAVYDRSVWRNSKQGIKVPIEHPVTVQPVTPPKPAPLDKSRVDSLLTKIRNGSLIGKKP